LMQDLLEPTGDGDPGALESFDRCIGCRACETACPSGVPFSLFEFGKELAAAARRKGAMPVDDPAVPSWLVGRLDRKPVLRALGALRPLAVGPRLRRLASSLPSAPGDDAELARLLDRLIGSRQEGAPRPADRDSATHAHGTGDVAIAFFTGCTGPSLMGATSRRLVDLLRHSGAAVRIPRGQDCCGALAGHTGRPQDREKLHARNGRAFAVQSKCDWIVVEAAGCGLELKGSGDFGPAAVLDATEALARLDLPALRPVPLKVAYHAACHLEHGQGVVGPPRELLRRIPALELVEPADPELCCGSGGVWSLEHPDLAADIGLRKAEALLGTGAQLVVTTNPGCLGQITSAVAALGAELPILPLSDLVWYAALG
ncbi:(Fe-S)-binding protein, partial [bacterium]|nr:(Fe-S)-binding protein [bacterium]